jgi:hypothetical protein
MTGRAARVLARGLTHRFASNKIFSGVVDRFEGRL